MICIISIFRNAHRLSMQLDALNAVLSGVRTILNSLGMERQVHCTKWLSIGYSILYCQWHHYIYCSGRYHLSTTTIGWHQTPCYILFHAYFIWAIPNSKWLLSNRPIIKDLSILQLQDYLKFYLLAYILLILWSRHYLPCFTEKIRSSV